MVDISRYHVVIITESKLLGRKLFSSIEPFDPEMLHIAHKWSDVTSVIDNEADTLVISDILMAEELKQSLPEDLKIIYLGCERSLRRSAEASIVYLNNKWTEDEFIQALIEVGNPDHNIQLLANESTEKDKSHLGYWENGFDEAVIFDLKTGEILSWNPAFETASGHSFAGHIPQNFEAVLSYSQPNEIPGWFQVLARKASFEIQCQRKISEQERYAVHLKMQTLDGTDTALAILKDISAQVHAEEAINLLMQSTTEMDRKQFAQLLSRFTIWAGLDYCAVLIQEKSMVLPEVLVEAGEIRPNETAIVYLSDLVEIALNRPILIPDRASEIHHENLFLKQNNIQALVCYPLNDAHSEQQGVLLAASRETLDAWKQFITLLRTFSLNISRDLSLQTLKKWISHQDDRDKVTGLPDRKKLFKDLNLLQSENKAFSLIVLQADFFDQFYANYGQLNADHILQKMAKSLKSFEEDDLVLIQLDLSSFIFVVHSHWQKEDFLQFAGRIQQVFSRGFNFADSNHQAFTVSFGVYQSEFDGAEVSELLQKSNIALKQAQEAGGNGIRFYDHTSGSVRLMKQKLARELPSAIKNQEFKLYYQPKVNASTEDISGMEALVRWQHQSMGMVSPALFIPLAEESHLIVDLGNWVLAEACRQAAEWNKTYQLSLQVGVNVSPLQLRDEFFVQRVESELKKSGLNPLLLDLEVTETMRDDDEFDSSVVLDELRELGCKVSIDDFGTGSSTLDDLRKFPADHVKIDQTFVRNIGADVHDEAIIKATVEMAHNLSMSIIAEGVETEGQLLFLQGLNCEYLQGYLFCKPLSHADFENLLLERERVAKQFSEQEKHLIESVTAIQDRSWL